MTRQWMYMSRPAMAVRFFIGLMLAGPWRTHWRDNSLKIILRQGGAIRQLCCVLCVFRTPQTCLLHALNHSDSRKSKHCLYAIQTAWITIPCGKSNKKTLLFSFPPYPMCFLPCENQGLMYPSIRACSEYYLALPPLRCRLWLPLTGIRVECSLSPLMKLLSKPLLMLPAFAHTCEKPTE